MEPKKKRYKWTKVQNRPTELENKPGGRDSQGVWEGHVHTALVKMDNQQGPSVEHMELCSMLCASLVGSWSPEEKRYMYVYD